MNPNEFVYLGRPITYFLSNAYINLVDGNVVVNLLVRIGLAPGVRFTVREGRLTVGAGIVLEVLD